MRQEGHTARSACCQPACSHLLFTFTQDNVSTTSSGCSAEDRCHTCLLRCQMCWSRGKQDIQHTAPNLCGAPPQKTFQHVEGFEPPQRRRPAILPIFASTQPQIRSREGVHHAIPSVMAQLLPAVCAQCLSPAQSELAR